MKPKLLVCDLPETYEKIHSLKYRFKGKRKYRDAVYEARTGILNRSIEMQEVRGWSCARKILSERKLDLRSEEEKGYRTRLLFCFRFDVTYSSVDPIEGAVCPLITPNACPKGVSRLWSLASLLN